MLHSAYSSDSNLCYSVSLIWKVLRKWFWYVVNCWMNNQKGSFRLADYSKWTPCTYNIFCQLWYRQEIFTSSVNNMILIYLLLNFNYRHVVYIPSILANGFVWGSCAYTPDHYFQRRYWVVCWFCCRNIVWCKRLVRMVWVAEFCTFSPLADAVIVS